MSQPTKSQLHRNAGIWTQQLATELAAVVKAWHTMVEKAFKDDPDSAEDATLGHTTLNCVISASVVVPILGITNGVAEDGWKRAIPDVSRSMVTQLVTRLNEMIKQAREEGETLANDTPEAAVDTGSP